MPVKKKPTRKPAKKKRPMGAPTKYTKRYCTAIIKYFDVPHSKIITETYAYKNGDTREREIEVANDIPLISEFANSIGVSKTTLLAWTERHPDFLNAYNKAKEMQLAFWMKNGLKGLYNAPFAIFTGKNMFGWRDQKDIDLKTDNKHKLELSDEDRQLIKELAKQMAITRSKG